MELKRFLIDRNHENWAKVFWERSIFQLLGTAFATLALYRVTKDCVRASRGPGSHAIVWYGLVVFLAVLILIGGQILGAVVYYRWFEKFFAAHRWNALQTFVSVARLLGLFCVVYSAWSLIVGWQNVGIKELGLNTMALAIGASMTGFGMVSVFFNILVFIFTLIFLAISKDLYFLLVAWICLATVAVSYSFSRIVKSAPQQREA
jgi:hypothetical protein